MAARHFLQNPSPLQVTKSELKREVVTSLGKEHAPDGLLDFLGGASSCTLTNFGIKQDAVAADIRKQFADLVESWIDALALKRFIAWRERQPHKVNASVPAIARKRVPNDVNEFDPFFRPHAQAAAIWRELGSSQMKKWSEHFKRFGCLTCGTREGYRGCGFCSRCHSRIRARLHSIETELRFEAARG